MATHARTYDKGRTVEAAAHIAGLARAKRAAHDLRGRDLLRVTCSNADAFLDALALRGAPLSPQTTQLVRLLERYGGRELDSALAEALGKGAVGSASVAHILDQRARRRRTAPALDMVLPDDPRVRDLRVTPHPLADYDRLLNENDDDDDTTR